MRTLATLAALAAAGSAQWGLQQHLGPKNRARSVLELDAAPSSLAFRLAAGGVREAAGDALWLTVLPRLGQSWTDTARKAAWVEAATDVLIDCDPRATTPPLYASTFLELIDPKHPGIERLLVKAMEKRVDGEEVNAGDWELPYQLGNILYARYGRGEAEVLAPALAWYRRAAALPECPTIVIDFIAALESRAGNELDGWLLYGTRAAGTENREWREFYLGQGDDLRQRVLDSWARAAETRLGRFPETVRDLLPEAGAATADRFRLQPELLTAFLEGVSVVPEAREVRVAARVKRLESEGVERVREWCRLHEGKQGRPPASLEDLRSLEGFWLPPAPRHGTRWKVDPDGEPGVEDWPEDPRLTAPAARGGPVEGGG